MKLIGLMPVRNEAWCLGLTLRVALMWCDEVVVFLHACTDRSFEIVREIREEAGVDRVALSVYSNPIWNEMLHRQWMLLQARDHGATHIAIIDADEILTGDLLTKCDEGPNTRIRYLVAGL